MVNIVLPEVSCLTAKEFLQALSPLGEYFSSNDLNSPWLFRGQGRDYPLVPSLFRQGGKLTTLTQRNIAKYSELLLAERDVLTSFFKIADKRGLILPDDSQDLRTSLEELSNDQMVGKRRGGTRITDSALSLMALAQHYGVPTRLLDWTRLPYVSAFFAAEDASRQITAMSSLEKLVVWAFYFPALGKQTLYGDDSYFIRGITAPSASNPNLKAQQGVFTLVNPGATEERSGNFRYKPFDKILEYYASGSSHEEWFLDCKIQKFILPASEAHNLLFLLAKMDITPSSIYPGYQNIITDMRNEIYFRLLSIK
ncbi:MAG TPA: FRG domain-containing protein [Anaerolineales bacterium]|nr:FRG domain-containing protein [Anaerolineales bacterium]